MKRFLFFLYCLFCASLFANTPYFNEKTKVNLSVPRNFEVKQTTLWKSIDLAHNQLPVTINVRMFVFPKSTMIDGIEEKGITINGFQIKRMTSVYDGWINLKERPGKIEESINANVSDNYVAVYAKDKLADDLTVSQFIAGEYYYLKDNIGYLISIQAFKKHWPKITKDAKAVVDSFWVGTGERPEQVVKLKTVAKPKDHIWAMYGGSIQNTNFSESQPNFSKLFEKKWSSEIALSTSNSKVGKPLISKDHIFMVADNQLFAFSISTGKKVWSYEMAGILPDHLVFDNGILYAFTKQTLIDMFAIIPETGSVLYKKSIEAHTISKPIIYEDALYLVEDGQLVSYKTVNGKQRWRHSYQLQSEHIPIINNDHVIVVTEDNAVLSAHVRTGRISWRSPNLVLDINNYLISESGVLVLMGNVPNPDGGYLSQIMALDSKNGQELWSFDKYSFSSFATAASLGEGLVFVPFLLGNDNERTSYLMVALDLDKGTIAWEQSFDMANSIKLIRPVLSKRVVAINGGSEKLGGIHAFDIHTGAVVTPKETIEPVQLETVRFYKDYIFTVSQNNGVLDLNALL